MQCSSRGFIFLWTLSLIMLISLLALTSMQHVLLYYKSINRQEKRHRQVYQMEHLALSLLANQPPNTECMSFRVDIKQLINLLKAHKECFIENEEITYSYFIEDLGEFPCLRVDNKNPSRHFKLFLLAQNPDGNPSLLQLRVIKPTEGSACDGAYHQVSAGVSSWLYVDSIPF